MAIEHMVWLTPKTGVGDAKMEEILASIRALTHLPGVMAISAGRNITDRANGATHGVLVTLESANDLSGYLRDGVARAL
jgi:phage-related tail protein